MLLLQTFARWRWPFLNEASTLIERYPPITHGGYACRDSARGISIAYEPNADRFVLALENRGEQKAESFSFGSSPDSCFHDTQNSSRGRWPLPWLMRGVLRRFHSIAVYSEYGFS